MSRVAEEGFLRLRCPLGGGLQVGSESGHLEKSSGGVRSLKSGRLEGNEVGEVTGTPVSQRLVGHHRDVEFCN